MTRTEVELLYGIAFPDSFYDFYAFLQGLPAEVNLREYLGISVAGPLRLLGSDPNPDNPEPLWEDRAYNDPPEFLVVLEGFMDGERWGFYVDDPNAPTFPIAHYWHQDAYEFDIAGADLFDVFRRQIEGYQSTTDEYEGYEMETPAETAEANEQLSFLRERLVRYTVEERPETGEDYFDQYPVITERKPVVAPTLERMGIVVSPELYCVPSLGDTDSAEERVDEALRLLHEGYPGTALQVGKNLWVEDQDELSYRLLDAAYAALGRDLLRKWLDSMIRFRAHCDLRTAEIAARRAQQNVSE